MYHEKQRKQLCALHALNNLLQDSKAFTQKDLDSICKSISPDTWFMNPHKSSLGLGNYDINVIMKALQTKELDTVWFDKRRDLKTGLDLNMIKGFILNIPNPPYNNKSHQWIFGLVSLPFSMIVSRRHWVAIIRSPADQLFYNLDSKQESPQLIGSDDQLIEYLSTKNNTSGCEIFVVIPRAVAEDQSWTGVDQMHSPHNP